LEGKPVGMKTLKVSKTFKVWIAEFDVSPHVVPSGAKRNEESLAFMLKRDAVGISRSRSAEPSSRGLRLSSDECPQAEGLTTKPPVARNLS
jgi:hypothetical protein